MSARGVNGRRRESLPGEMGACSRAGVGQFQQPAMAPEHPLVHRAEDGRDDAVGGCRSLARGPCAAYDECVAT